MLYVTGKNDDGYVEVFTTNNVDFGRIERTMDSMKQQGRLKNIELWAYDPREAPSQGEFERLYGTGVKIISVNRLILVP